MNFKTCVLLCFVVYLDTSHGQSGFSISEVSTSFMGDSRNILLVCTVTETCDNGVCSEDILTVAKILNGVNLLWVLHKLPEQSEPKTTTNVIASTFYIGLPTVADAGVYTCSASLNDGITVDTQTSLTIQLPSPVVTIDSSLVFGELGMSATLECNITLPDGYDIEKYPDTSYNIEWIYKGATVDRSSTPINTDSVVSQYIVNTVSQSTVGNYICQVTIIYTGDQTQYVDNSNKVSGMIILETIMSTSSYVMTSSISVSSQPIDNGVVVAAVLVPLLLILMVGGVTIIIVVVLLILRKRQVGEESPDSNPVVSIKTTSDENDDGTLLISESHDDTNNEVD